MLLDWTSLQYVARTCPSLSLNQNFQLAVRPAGEKDIEVASD